MEFEKLKYYFIPNCQMWKVLPYIGSIDKLTSNFMIPKINKLIITLCKEKRQMPYQHS